jgi:hypothetical protein
MKIEGSGSRSISQRHGSADPHPNPDPHQNVMDPQHCVNHFATAMLFLLIVRLVCLFFMRKLGLKRLDQGHLHSKLEFLGLTCPGRESNRGEHSKKRAMRNI